MASGAGQARLPMPSTSDRGWGLRTWIPAADGYDERLGTAETRTQTLRKLTDGLTKPPVTMTRAADPANSPSYSVRRDLGPDGDHAEKQGDRGQRGSFLNNGAKHDVLPERTENIVHVCSFVKPPSQPAENASPPLFLNHSKQSQKTLCRCFYGIGAGEPSMTIADVQPFGKSCWASPFWWAYSCSRSPIP